MIFCFVAFNSSGNKFHSYTNVSVPKVIDTCSLMLYQVVLSFLLSISLLLRFRSKKEFILDRTKVGLSNEKCLPGRT